MRLFLALAVAFLLVQNAAPLTLLLQGGLDYDAARQGEVVLLGTADCPWCARVRAYFALNPPYGKWPELFPPLQARVLQGASSVGAKLIAVENLYMYGPNGGRPITEDLPHAPQYTQGHGPRHDG